MYTSVPTPNTSNDRMACRLCSKHNPKMKTLRQMKNHDKLHSVFEWLGKNEPTLTESESISLPCVKQIHQNSHKQDFLPRWKPKCSITKKCSIENCQAELYTHTTLASIEQIETFPEERVLGFTISSSSESVGLCKEHYTRMYLHLHPAKLCVVSVARTVSYTLLDSYRMADRTQSYYRARTYIKVDRK